MKRAFLVLIMAAFMAAGVANLSCAREEKTEKKAKANNAESKLPPGHAEQVEKMKKEMEEAKKIVVAKVNGADITMYSFVGMMNRLASRYFRPGHDITPEMTEKVKKEAIELLVFQELAIQEAIKQGIEVKPEEIDKMIEGLKTRAGSEDAYRQSLERIGLTEAELRKEIERGKRYETIVGREIYSKVEVDEKLIREVYEKEKDRLVMPEAYVAEDVFFLSGKDDEATRKKADEILKDIKKNENDTGKLTQDGSFIVRNLNVTPAEHPAIHKAMEGMKVGDVSGIIKDNDGLHIIKVKKKEPSRKFTFEESKGILEQRLRAPQQDKLRAEWEEKLRKDAKIEVLLDEVEKEMKAQAEVEGKK